MATQQTPPRRSVLRRYAPLIAVIVVVAIVVLIVGIVNHNNTKTKNNAVTTSGATGPQNFSDVPILYSEARAKGTLDQYTWQPHCDTTTGEVALPILDPPPCVPAPSSSNGGATSPGVTGTTIKIGYYVTPPDPAADALLKAAGAYDSPASVAQSYLDYMNIYSNLFETYGRKIEMVKIQGTGNSTDEVAAKADADKAAADGVFAVMGGPAQTRSFAAELASKQILCIGGCVTASPTSILEQAAPYMWSTLQTPEQSGLMAVQMIKSQLLGKPVSFAGGNLNGKPRVFALLSYDTPDGKYKSTWDQFYKELGDAGVPLAKNGHVSYFLNIPSLVADSRTIATKLKSIGATTIVFTGDPIFPNYLTHAMTQQNYFPEWVMAGTVLADTNVFARTFDQQQWKHAMGLLLASAENKLPATMQDSYTLYKWWFGKPPVRQKGFAITDGEVRLLMTGIQLAGPHLTAETFRDGLFHIPPQPAGPGGIGTIVTYGNHGYWQGTDWGGLDNAGIIYWDPTAKGEDETGAYGTGMYRMIDGGRRYLPNQWPTTPIKLFDPAGTVTTYTAQNVPPELVPKQYPVPTNAPAVKK
jgi:hypothetical protein